MRDRGAFENGFCEFRIVYASRIEIAMHELGANLYREARSLNEDDIESVIESAPTLPAYVQSRREHAAETACLRHVAVKNTAFVRLQSSSDDTEIPASTARATASDAHVMATFEFLSRTTGVQSATTATNSEV